MEYMLFGGLVGFGVGLAGGILIGMRLELYLLSKGLRESWDKSMQATREREAGNVDQLKDSAP